MKMKQKIELVFPDGKKKEFDKGTTGLKVAQSIGSRLAQDALAVQLNGKTLELDMPLEENGDFRVLTWNDIDGKKAFWHTTAHVLNEAVQELFPDAQPTIGPPIEDGYYYDFDVQTPFTKEDLEKIEKKMIQIISKKEKTKRKEITKQEALKLFEKNKYKQELINEFSEQGKKLTIYSTGKFFDLCKGGHIEDTSKIKAFKLTKTAGAYWRGSEKNKMLQRIYGIAFPQQKILEEHLKVKEETEKRDHRKLGQELELFMFHEYSPGAAFFLPKGTAIFNELVNFIRTEYRKRGFQEIITPQLFNKKLWETSGHWQHYRENMFTLKIDEQDFALKAMNCPSHVLMYKSKRHSYRDLPLRVADFGALHRNELHGVLGGLTRVRKFQQDDSHTFCTQEQIEKEIIDLLDFIKHVYQKTFQMNFRAKLSTRPKDFMGEEKLWDTAEDALSSALKKSKLEFEVKKGEGAFYGPKIDVDVEDALGRNWQLATIQLDFQMPKRFEAEYIGQDDKPHTPVMIHIAILGSLERFIGLLIEQYSGNFPVWLAPVQAKIFPVSEKYEEYCKKVYQELMQKGIRAEMDLRQETVSYKVRDAQLQKTPYILTVGEKEEQKQTISVRDRNGKVTFDVKADKFVQEILQQKPY